MVDAVLFDFNGTMIFDAEVNRRAWDVFLRQLIGRPATEAEFMAHIQGVNSRDTILYFMGADVSDEEADALGEEEDRIYRETLVATPEAFRLVDGLAEFLDLFVVKGVALNIASAAPPANMDLFFEHLGLSRWFDRSKVALNDGILASKPAPDVYLAAAANAGADPSRSAVFEDAESGIAAAHAAGARVVAVLSGLTREKALALPGVVGAITDYTNARALMALLD